MGNFHHLPSPTITMDSSMASSSSTKPETGNGVELLANDEVRRLMHIVQSLRHLGIEATDLTFPKLCVTGDQSTGKSSLIEGISEVKVPRGSGTCTRCPVEINLSDDPSPTATWKCDIYLSQKYTFLATALSKATRARPLGPWVEKELETFAFARLHNKHDVGLALEYAQLATLNPGSDFAIYQPHSNTSISKKRQVPFSPNVVRMDISGPNLLNLSFFDLPGIVSQDDQHGYVPLLVENLVKDYIRAENCVILHTLTMNHDAANSIAARVINEAQANDRTVGVLTKPDLFRDDSIDQWREILDGQSYERKLGYYVVKNNAEASVDHVTARMEEVRFFESTAPFSTDLAYHSSHFGTINLQKALSSMLAQQIKSSLPKILKKIRLKLDATTEKLTRMPKPPEGNVAGIVEAKICDFARKIANEVDGGSLECETFFFTEWHAEARKFGDFLVCSRPMIKRPVEVDPPRVPIDESPTPSRTTAPAEAMVISDDEGPTAKKSKPNGTPQAGNKRPNRGDAIPQTPKKATLSCRIQQKPAFEKGKDRSTRFTIPAIRDKLRKLDTGSGSVGHPKVVENMYQEALAHWPDLTEEFVVVTGGLCETHLSQWIENTFGCWAKAEIYDRIREATRKFLERELDEEHQLLNAMCGMERRKLLVLDTEEDAYNEQEMLHEFGELSKSWRTVFEIKTRESRGVILGTSDKEQIGERVRAATDPYFAELHALAKVRSHYHSAATQFARYASLSICTRLFESMRKKLPDEIRHAIGLNLETANDEVKKLLAVDAATEAERQRLIRDERALREGYDQLMALSHPLSFSSSSNLLSQHRSDMFAGPVTPPSYRMEIRMDKEPPAYHNGAHNGNEDWQMEN